MKKDVTKKIIIGLLIVIVAITGIVPLVASKAHASEKELSDNIVLVTDNAISEQKKDGYNKIIFRINDDTKEIYVKNGDTVTLKSDNKDYGIIVGGFNNGDSITSDTTIYAKTYLYDETLDLSKEILSEEPDENGYYTLKFTAASKNLPSLTSDNNNIVIVMDRSSSMACSINTGADDDKMAASYEDTRWYVATQSVNNFLKYILPDGSNNKVSIIMYCKTATAEIINSSDRNEIMEKINSIYTKSMYEEDYNYYDFLYGYKKRNNVGYVKEGLGNNTNIEQGLNKVSDIVDNLMGTSVILFTDGDANTYDSDKIWGTYYVNGKEYTGSEDNLNGSYYAQTAGKKLSDAGAEIYTIALMKDNKDINDLVRVSLGNKTLSYTKSKFKTKFTYSDGGYADKFYTASNTDELNKSFNQIMVSITALPFESSEVTDTLDDHFELVAGQNDVTDNGDGTFTVKYAEKISSQPQTAYVKIKAKDGYAGYSYTNKNCIFNGKISGLTFSKEFTDTPAAVILPSASDDEYSVKQDTILNGTSVLDNDNNQIVNNPDKVRSLKAVVKTETKHGKVILNDDGTFEYTPDKGYSGKDTFEYNVVLNVNGKEYTKSATVIINIDKVNNEHESESESESEGESQSQSESGSNGESQSQSESSLNGESQSESQISSDSGANENNSSMNNNSEAQVAADQEKVVSNASIKTGDKSLIIYYGIIVMSIGTIIITTVLQYRKRSNQ